MGNKVDVPRRQVKLDAIHLKKRYQYYDVSCKSNYNYEKPFLHLARRLLNDPTLYFVEMPVASAEIRPIAAGAANSPSNDDLLEALATPLDEEEQTDVLSPAVALGISLATDAHSTSTAALSTAAVPGATAKPFSFGIGARAKEQSPDGSTVPPCATFKSAIEPLWPLDASLGDTNS